MSKVKEVVCVFLGHSRIRFSCFGYHYCGRCRAQLGDSLAGGYSPIVEVDLDCACDKCVESLKSLSWKDYFLAPKIPWVKDPVKFRAEQIRKKEEVIKTFLAEKEKCRLIVDLDEAEKNEQAS